VAKVIERVEACYEVRGVDPVYGTHPESVVAECDRGERPALNASRTNRVQRGVDHVAIGEQVSDTRLEGEVDRPRGTTKFPDQVAWVHTAVGEWGENDLL
jgi:hypothetical protein